MKKKYNRNTLNIAVFYFFNLKIFLVIVNLTIFETLIINDCNMSVESQFNLKQIIGILFERSKINSNFKYHRENRRKYILFGKKITKRFWTNYYFGLHQEYSEEEIKENEQFMIIGDSIFYRPSIKIMFTNDKKLIYYFENDFKAEKVYNEIIKQMEGKIPICDIEKICRTQN